MALKQIQQLKLQQRLLPQQILLIKLLTLPVQQLEDRIREELNENPALTDSDAEAEEDNSAEADSPESSADAEDAASERSEDAMNENDDFLREEKEIRENADVNVEDFMDDEELDSYKYEVVNQQEEEEYREPIAIEEGRKQDFLLEQLHVSDLSEKENIIGEYLIGCLDDDGYLRRDIQSIADDLLFKMNVDVSVEEVKKVLKVIQGFDPPGVGATSLQECLLIQLKRMNAGQPEVKLAFDIVKFSLEDLGKKLFDKILNRHKITKEEFLKAYQIIQKLNPRPGLGSTENSISQGVQPDVIISVVNGKPEISLHPLNQPELFISREYLKMLEEYSSRKSKAERDAGRFVREKIDQAKWFIEALEQRRLTLLKGVMAIVELQEEFIQTGDEAKLKPMILKDVAEKTGLDISTVSRLVNSKYVQTPYGTYPLKWFFSDKMTDAEGEEVSNREIKSAIRELIEKEDKKNPMNDDELCEALNKKGYKIARRTVAKYREELQIPVARLRKEL